MQDEERGIVTTDLALLFFHIGRTGGTWLTRYFHLLAPRSYIQAGPFDMSGLQTCEGNDANAPLFISGHYPVAPSLSALSTRWQTMIVLRSPVQHLLSSYWHLRTHAADIDNADTANLIAAAKRLDFPTLLDTREGLAFDAYLDNPQTRFVLDRPVGPLTRDDLSIAVELLKRVTHVGITERLEEFAAQVASALPWAAGRWNLPLSPMMTNPSNVLDTDELPRALLRKILISTEFDAELYEYAQQRQAGGPTVSRPMSLPFRSKLTSDLQVVDLLRVSSLTMSGLRLGLELVVENADVMLHPPKKGDGCAFVTIGDVVLDHHSEVLGCLMLTHPSAAPVRFEIELLCQGAILVSSSFVVAAGQPCSVRLGFPSVKGKAQLTLRTEMAETKSHDFAWATFAGFRIC